MSRKTKNKNRKFNKKTIKGGNALTVQPEDQMIHNDQNDIFIPKHFSSKEKDESIFLRGMKHFRETPSYSLRSGERAAPASVATIQSQSNEEEEEEERRESKNAARWSPNISPWENERMLQAPEVPNIYIPTSPRENELPPPTRLPPPTDESLAEASPRNKRVKKVETKKKFGGKKRKKQNKRKTKRKKLIKRR